MLEPPAVALTLSADPLDKPLAGQDAFFLEQTKKKGVRVRLSGQVTGCVRVGGRACVGTCHSQL
jgi:hypothetical protein